MATIAPTVTKIGPEQYKVTWEGVATGDTITEHNAVGIADCAAFQAAGTFAGGTSVGLTASLDSANYFAATDVGTTAVSAKTAAFMVALSDKATSFLPTIASGTADSVDFTLTYKAG